MDERLLRLGLALEFLIALVAIFTVWGQVAGPGHLEIMPWSWKLFLGVGLAYAIVRATAAAAREERPWNGRTLRWISVILTLSAAAALLTFYYHMNEPVEEEEEVVEPQEMSSRRDRRHPSFSGKGHSSLHLAKPFGKRAARNL